MSPGLDTKPHGDHAPLSGIRDSCNVLVSVHASLLVRYKRCPLLGDSVYISYIGESAGAKARRPLDRDV